MDSTGATIDFPLSAHRDAASAKRFFQKVLRSVGQLTPRVIHVDQPPAIHPWYMPSAVLNNILLEQDHRAIKRRVKAIQGFRSFWAARRTIAGYEAVNMIRKGPARRVGKGEAAQQLRLVAQLFDLAA